MINVLFTKYYPEKILQKKLGAQLKVISHDFISAEMIDKEIISHQIKHEINTFICSSARAARQIKDLPLNGTFYCVGKTSADILQQNSKTVRFCAETAAELVAYFEKNFPAPKRFHFFCSDIRRDEIPDSLKKLGHEVDEIIVYKTVSRKVDLNGNWDAVAFFSPSGVKSFAQQYAVPENAVIFAIGSTTANAVAEILKRTALTPQNAELESLTELIKKFFDAEK